MCGACFTKAVFVSKVGDVELPPLAVEQARALLAELLAAWQQGMCRPLPLAAKTAFAYLKAGSDAARTEYEGGYRQPGEVESDAYLLRVYPDFAALSRDGEFFELAERLLRPLHEAMHAGNDASAGRSAKAGRAVA